MPAPLSILRSRWSPALGLLGVLALPATARADFQITYIFTNADGEPLPSQRLTATDMQAYSNLASCQCGHVWGARVFLDNSVGTAYPGNTLIDTYVGANCGDGQESFGSQNDPCVKVFDGTANDYDDNGILIPFEQVWLSSRSDTRDEPVSSATPILPCDLSQTGGGGIWICVESNGQSNCQKEEFVVMGDSSVNSAGSTETTDPTTGMGTTPATNIQFDYLEPQDDFGGFRAQSGDGAVVISWNSAENNDTSGFRVLCADMDGNNPAPKVTGAPEGRSRTNGKLYYTAENLCPGEVVYTPDPNATPPEPVPEETGTGSSDDGTSSGAIDAPWLGDGWSMATGTGSGTETGAASGTETGIGTASGTTGEDTGAGTSGGDGVASPIESLDWRYVCSDHVANTGTSVRVDGLENGKEYQFLVVSYDGFGNPKILSEVLTATPIETSDFWEQCEEQGDLCGNGGFCSCTSDPSPMGAAWLGTGLLLLGLARRRRSEGGSLR